MGLFSGKRVAVIGLGKSGLAAAQFLEREGAALVLNDSATTRSSAHGEFEKRGAKLLLGGHDALPWTELDLVVISPGVPSFPELERAASKGLRVIGEIELASMGLALHSEDARIFAIGGTNGKSTVTTLVGELLARPDCNVFTGGNLGEPLAAHLEESFDEVVLEVSSFQMERILTFRPSRAALLNVTPDHLDRYADMAAYARAKGNMFVNQTAADYAIVPVGDAVCVAEAKRGKGRIVTFGPSGNIDVTPTAIVDRLHFTSISRSKIRLQGGHNAMNVAAAMALVSGIVTPSRIAEVLESFEGLPHRMALVAEVNGVRYYDDSKGTNVGASVTALQGLAESRAVLIAGGKDKGGSYGPLRDALQVRGRAVVLIGEATSLIEAALEDVVPVRRAGSMDEAVQLASELAQTGDAVLLSPACSSFDMFRDYKHRGEEFVRGVEEQAKRAK